MIGAPFQFFTCKNQFKKRGKKMSDAALAVQNAVLTSLVSDLTEPVYDYVPQAPTYPYVYVGDDKQKDWSAGGFEGESHTLVVHAWSQTQGRTELKTIMKKVKDSLHGQNLSVTGHTLVLLRWHSSEAVVEADGITHHGIQKFKVLTQEV